MAPTGQWDTEVPGDLGGRPAPTGAQARKHGGGWGGAVDRRPRPNSGHGFSAKESRETGGHLGLRERLSRRKKELRSPCCWERSHSEGSAATRGCRGRQSGGGAGVRPLSPKAQTDPTCPLLPCPLLRRGTPALQHWRRCRAEDAPRPPPPGRQVLAGEETVADARAEVAQGTKVGSRTPVAR